MVLCESKGKRPKGGFDQATMTDYFLRAIALIFPIDPRILGGSLIKIERGQAAKNV